MIRTYSKLSRIATFEERFRYLNLFGDIGNATFGFDRHLNQRFYSSSEWKHIRHEIITRDKSCDLGIEGYEIHDRAVIHHMNPMTTYDLTHGDDSIMNPEFLITTTHRTHNAIHFGDESSLLKPFVERKVGDTKLW